MYHPDINEIHQETLVRTSMVKVEPDEASTVKSEASFNLTKLTKQDDTGMYTVRPSYATYSKHDQLSYYHSTQLNISDLC